jgi:UPF0755 protein
MLDDLELAWEESERPGRGGSGGRQIRQRRRKERKTRRRSFGALLISLILLAALGGGVYWGVGKLQDKFGAPDYDTMGTEPVNVKIPKDSNATQIGDILQEKDVVKSSKAFQRAALADQQHSQLIQPGTYKLVKHMPAAQALAALLPLADGRPPASRVSIDVTIPEGKTYMETFALLSAKTKIPVADFTAAAKDPTALGVQDWWFNRTDGKDADKTVEGFLFPATYSFDPDESATQILTDMVDTFNTQVGKLGFTDTVQSKLSISPYEALIVASLAQAEAGQDADLPKIARVAYNRTIKYKDTFPCACLQFDVTANYYLMRNGKAKKPSNQLTESELDNPQNPWNTGKSTPGLPIGPIDSPGLAALQGAMSPAVGNWLYFVAVDKKNPPTTLFANTLAEQQHNIAIAQQNGVL